MTKSDSIWGPLTPAQKAVATRRKRDAARYVSFDTLAVGAKFTIDLFGRAMVGTKTSASEAKFQGSRKPSGVGRLVSVLPYTVKA